MMSFFFLVGNEDSARRGKGFFFLAISPNYIIWEKESNKSFFGYEP